MSDGYKRQTDPDYQGVVAQRDLFRVIVGRAADGSFYYRLQTFGPCVGAASPQWVPVERSSATSLKALVRKLAASTDGLLAAVAVLPDDPATASPAMLAVYRAVDAGE